MPKTIIGTIGFALVVVVLWAGATYLLDPGDINTPAISQDILQPLDPSVNRNYMDNLQARADNRIGIELEL